MENIDKAVELFAETIKETATYCDYYTEKEKVKSQPGLKQQLDEFREKNFEVQNLSKEEELIDKIDALEKEYETFRENPLVDSFLSAELSFCRMMQKIYSDLSDKVEFE